MPASHDDRSLADALRRELGHGRGAIVWEEDGDAVLVHVDALTVELSKGIIVVSVPLETDQTGRDVVACSFAIGEAGPAGDMVAVTTDRPRGHAVLVARWGEALQNVIWSALDDLVDRDRDVPVRPRPSIRIEPGVFAWGPRPPRRPG